MYDGPHWSGCWDTIANDMGTAGFLSRCAQMSAETHRPATWGPEDVDGCSSAACALKRAGCLAAAPPQPQCPARWRGHSGGLTPSCGGSTRTARKERPWEVGAQAHTAKVGSLLSAAPQAVVRSTLVPEAKLRSVCSAQCGLFFTTPPSDGRSKLLREACARQIKYMPGVHHSAVGVAYARNKLLQYSCFAQQAQHSHAKVISAVLDTN